MPRLTPSHSWRPGLPGQTAARPSDLLGFGVPAHAHPLVAPGEWAELARPGSPLHWVVLNVASGPGSMPDTHCTAAVARVRGAGVPVLGHLDAAFGARPFGALVSEASHYLDWYRTDGFYVHRPPPRRSGLADTRRLTTTLRALLRGGANGGHIVLGHGTHPDPGYAEIADQLVTFAGPWDRYRWSEAPEWTAAHPPARFCHQVYGIPRPHLPTAMRIARWQGAATVFFTNRTDRSGADPWEGLPDYWNESVRTVRNQPPPSM